MFLLQGSTSSSGTREEESEGRGAAAAASSQTQAPQLGRTKGRRKGLGDKGRRLTGSLGHRGGGLGSDEAKGQVNGTGAESAVPEVM